MTSSSRWFVRPKHSVGKITGGFGAALFDLELHDALATIEKSHLKLRPNQGASLRIGIQSPREFFGRYGGRRRLFHTEGGDAESCGSDNKSEKEFHGHRINSRRSHALRGSYPACRATLGISRELRQAG